MIELDQIRADIARLKDIENQDDIPAAVEEIFFNLIYADQPFYIALLKNSPYIAPSKTDPRHFYLRLFSHESVAGQYQSRNEGIEIVGLSLEETMQLAKTMFIRGAYGYLLNEGDKWIQIPFPNYLRLFLSRVLHTDSSYSEPCVQVISFLNELRRNSVYRYGAVCREQGGEWRGPDGECLIQPDNAALPGREYIARPISVQSLYHIPQDTVRIITPENDFEVSTLLLQGGLDYCGFHQDKDSELFVSDYFDEPAPISAEDRDWHTEDLSLSFEPSTPELPPNSPDVPAPSEEDPQDGKHPIPMPGFLTSILSKGRAFLGQRREKAIGEDEEEEPEAVIEEPEETPEEACEEAEREGEDPGKAGRKDGEEAGCEDGEETGCAGESGRAAKGQKRRPIIIISLCALLVIGCIAGVFGVRRHQRQEQMNLFYSCIDAREYGNAYTIYNSSNLGSDADEYLSDHLDSLVIKYANNTLSAEDLSASMQSLANFPSLEQNLEIAKLTASKLEASKNAYVQGKESEDVFGKLDLWRQVVDLDSVNYAAVQKAVAENQDAYIGELNNQITRYSTLLRDFAKARYEVLAYWYPDAEATANWAEYYLEDGKTQLAFYPISISSIKIEEQSDHYWALCINWKNTSVKTIQEICFVVVALDENGNYVTCQDSIGAWTIFEARDSSTYTPGEETPVSNYQWNRVFYGSAVARVQLTAVNITYADGSTSSFTTEGDLNAILP